MNKNPLTPTIIIFAIGDAYTVREAIVNGKVDILTALAWLQGLVLFILYFKRSKYAGSYLFYSLLPFFPIYFGLKATGLNPPPATPEIYVIAFIIYASAIALSWKQKREYERYLSATEQPLAVE
jgi:hypothetical protein